MINASYYQLKMFFALCMELSFVIIKKEEYEDVKLYFTMPHILSFIDSIAIPMQRGVYLCSFCRLISFALIAQWCIST